jgi:hypothetical protein
MSKENHYEISQTVDMNSNSLLEVSPNISKMVKMMKLMKLMKMVRASSKPTIRVCIVKLFTESAS